MAGRSRLDGQPVLCPSRPGATTEADVARAQARAVGAADDGRRRDWHGRSRRAPDRRARTRGSEIAAALSVVALARPCVAAISSTEAEGRRKLAQRARADFVSR